MPTTTPNSRMRAIRAQAIHYARNAQYPNHDRISPQRAKPSLTVEDAPRFQRTCIEHIGRPNEFLYLYRLKRTATDPELYVWLTTEGTPEDRTRYRTAFAAIEAKIDKGWLDASWE